MKKKKRGRPRKKLTKSEAGLLGALARAANLTARERRHIAVTAAKARWGRRRAA